MPRSAQVFRASFLAYTPFVFLPVPLALGTLIAFKHSDWLGSFILLLSPLALWICLSRFRLVITSEKVTYRSPFRRVQSMRRSEIVSVRFAFRAPWTNSLTIVV